MANPEYLGPEYCELEDGVVGYIAIDRRGKIRVRTRRVSSYKLKMEWLPVRHRGYPQDFGEGKIEFSNEEEALIVHGAFKVPRNQLQLGREYVVLKKGSEFSIELAE